MAAINKRKLLDSAQRNLQKGALDKALKDYQTILEADPRDSNVRLKMGDLQIRRGSTEDAISAYLKVADQFMRDGFDAKAVAIYKQVTKIDAKRHDVQVPLADLYQRLGLTSEAMAALQIAADAYRKEGRKREALDLLRRMANLEASNVTSRLKVAELLQQEGLVEEALHEYGEAAAELDRQGDWEARAGVLQRIVELAPARVESLAALAELFFEHRQATRAEPLARALALADPGRAESHELLAQIYTELGQRERAVDCYRLCAEAWRVRGDEDRSRQIVQRFLPAEPFGLGSEAGAAEETERPELGSEGEPISFESFGAADEGDLGVQPLVSDAEAPEASDAAEDVLDTGEGDRRPIAAPTTLPLRAGPQPTPRPVMRPAARTAPKPLPVAARAAAPAPEEAPVDSEQVLAEAAVYLRYGKHERALSSLETVLARLPDHGGALELLGDVLAADGAVERAIEAWTGAARAASAAGDAARIESLCERIEALDAGAAAELAASLGAPAARGAAAPTVLFDVDAATGGDHAAEAGAAEGFDLDEIEIDVDEDSDSTGAADDESPAAFEETPGDGCGDEAADEPVEAAGIELAGESGSEIEIDLDAPAFDAGAIETDARETEADAPEAAGPELTGELDPEALEAAAREIAADPALGAEGEGRFEIDPGGDEDVEVALAGALAAERSSDAEPPVDLSALAAVEDDTDTDRESPVEVQGDALRAEAAALDLVGADLTEPQGAPEAWELPDEPERREVESDGPEIAAARAPAPPASRAVPDPVSAPTNGLSTSTSQHIVEEFEEAGFYFEQGLLAEADAIYRRILERAPNHPGALLRLGEIAVRRGHDPGESVRDMQGEVEAPAAVPETPPDDGFGTAAPELLEPPDALDLTEPALADEIAVAPVVPPVRVPGPAVADPSDDTARDLRALAEPEPSVIAEITAPPVALESDLTAPGMPQEQDPRGAAFDLAAEISEALADQDENATSGPGASTDEDGFAALFREFKRGVSQTLDEGDVETHFDLGIAYREMGLFEDAIGEFRYALGTPARRMDALHMMGLCAIELDRAQDAVGHLEQALAAPEVPAEREAPVRYDLGRAYEALGDVGRALDAYRRVAELDGAFQDVAQRIAAIVQGLSRHSEAPPAPEAYESFDDLIAETAEPAEPASDPAPVAERFESFEDVFEEEGEAEPVPVEPEAAVPAEAPPDAVAPTADPEPAEPPPSAPKRRRKVSFV